jgi:hypothetical protein
MTSLNFERRGEKIEKKKKKKALLVINFATFVATRFPNRKRTS